MAEKTDIREVQAALDRAAHKAVHGPKEARTGRFTGAPRSASPTKAPQPKRK